MLAKHLDNEEVNQLPAVLEEPAMARVLKVLWFGLVDFVVVVAVWFCLFLNIVTYDDA